MPLTERPARVTALMSCARESAQTSAPASVGVRPPANGLMGIEPRRRADATDVLAATRATVATASAGDMTAVSASASATERRPGPARAATERRRRRACAATAAVAVRSGGSPFSLGCFVGVMEEAEELGGFFCSLSSAGGVDTEAPHPMNIERSQGTDFQGTPQSAAMGHRACACCAVCVVVWAQRRLVNEFRIFWDSYWGQKGPSLCVCSGRVCCVLCCCVARCGSTDALSSVGRSL